MVIEPKDTEENNWGFGTDDHVSAVAGKMYGARVKAVRDEAAKYDIGADRLRKTFHAARTEADRSAAILLFAMAEDLMLHGLRQHLQGEVKGGWAEMGSGNGLLATANDRITLLALLGWIHPGVYSDLRMLKAIRNRFAHHPDVIGFDEQTIRGHISALFPIEEGLLKTVGLSDDTQLSPRQLYLIRAGNALTRLVLNLAVAPIARQERVAPGHIDMVAWDELPPNLQELNRVLAEHAIATLQPSPVR